MITTIEQLTAKVGGEYIGLRESGHLIKKTYIHPTKGTYCSYQYFIEGICSICNKTHFNRKWKRTTAHVECSCLDIVKRRKPRKDRVNK